MLSNFKLNIGKFTLMQGVSCLWVFTIAIISSSSIYADASQHKVPGIDRSQVSYTVPEDLASLSTQEIENIRASHHRDLAKIKNGVDSKQIAEDKMLEELMAHDLVRLSITDVIPNLIEEYEINGEFKKTLLGYRSTFTDELMSSRETVETLQDYQSYDFRFAAVYMSMLFSFQEYPDFYEKLKVDMVDEDTSIGGYRKLLDDSYGGVEKARAQMEMVHSKEDVEKVISALDAELERRSH